MLALLDSEILEFSDVQTAILGDAEEKSRCRIAELFADVLDVDLAQNLIGRLYKSELLRERQSGGT